MGFDRIGLGVILVLLLDCSIAAETYYRSGEQQQQQQQSVRVGGKVVCQDCTKGWTEWVQGDKPLKGCKVSMTCMDERKRVVYYTSDETDEEGAFEMIINSEAMNGKGLRFKRDGCLVRLVSSPDQLCNLITDFGGGRSGVRLDQPSLVYRDLMKYTVGPFYFTTPMCDEPDTTTANQGSNY